MLRIAVFASVCVLSLCVASCDLAGGGGDDGCGAERITGNRISGGYVDESHFPVVPQASNTNFANEEGSQASISWKIEQKDVCTKRHSNLDALFRVREEVADQVSFKVVVWYGIFKEYPLTLTRRQDGNMVVFEGSREFGIRDVYGDGPGEFSIFADMYFPSTGYWDTDSAYVDFNLRNLKIGATVWDFSW